MEHGKKSEEITHTAAWRLGPNPSLVNFALFATIAEMLLLFLRKPIDPKHNEFLVGAIIFGALFFWITITWIGWFISRGIARLRPRSLAQQFTSAAIAFVATTLGCLYLACWVDFLYAGLFPDVEMFSFLVNGSASELNFMLSIVQQTFPNAGLFVLGAMGVMAVAVPFGLRRFNLNYCKQARLHGEGATKLLMWMIPGLACLFFAGMTQADADLQTRKEAVIRMKTQANPAFSIVASLIDRTISEAIPKQIDMRLLRSIVTPPHPSAAELARAAKAPNVFFLAVESLRSDMIGKKHQGRLVMPNMTALAAKSLVFTNAHSQATHTDYSITSFLSSQYPMRSTGHYHPIVNAGFPKTMIYDWLKRYGFATGIITSDNTDWCGMANFMISPKGLDVFFDSRNMPTTYSAWLRGYSATRPEKTSTRGETLIDNRAVDYARAWLNDQFKTERPVFLHLMFQRTHFSYPNYPGSTNPFQPAGMKFTATFDAYPRDEVEVVRNAYFNAAYNVDLQLGRFLNYLQSSGKMENSIIVLVGDHGEGFFEHNMVTHSRLPYEEFSRIPMIVYLPPALASQYNAPRKIDYPTEQIDMPPTVCGLLGLPPSPAFQGIDVLSENRPPLARRFTFTHVEAPGQASGECVIQAGRWKYMQDRSTGIDFLFDLKNDPAEKSNVKSDNPQITARLRNKLQLWRNSHLSYYKYNMYYEHYYQPNLALGAAPQ